MTAFSTARSPAHRLTAQLAALGPVDLRRRRVALERLVRADGISYGGVTPESTPRPWRLDPLPVVIGEDEWTALEAGLEQRARMLDALLTDLTGSRSLLHRRVLPATLVLGHEGFLPPVDGIPVAAERQLGMLATDLVRDSDGRWLVVADRSQAPSGAGYAMANRRLVSRVMESAYRDSPVRRIRGFFDLMYAAMVEAAPPTDDAPHVVLFTPGLGSETSYDQALLSTIVGTPLVQSDDLTVREGRLWLRTMAQAQQVDVVQRRVDVSWCDSLDLRPESRLGVVGLAAAARRGTVSIVNPLGAGLLENPGLGAFDEVLHRELLGEERLLTTPRTWWCGDDLSRRHVLARLAELVIRPASRGVGPSAFPGWELDGARRDDLVRQIRARPWAWVAQDPVNEWTTPAVTSAGLVERPTVLRTFGVAVGGAYRFMHGGLARVAATDDQFVVTNASGARSKDVWVLESADAEPAPVVVLVPRRGASGLRDRPGLTPHAAENLYWLGRYAERTEATARLLLVAEGLVEDHLRSPGTPGHGAMTSTLRAVSKVTRVQDGFTGSGAEERLVAPAGHLSQLLVDRDRVGTVAYAALRATNAAEAARELLSVDTFGVLARLSGVLDGASDEESIDRAGVCTQVLDACLALSGISAESLVRDAIWGFLEAGRRIERAQTTVRLLRYTLALVRPPVADALIAETVLRAGDSLITYQRRMVFGTGAEAPLAAAVELLLTDASNPRSVQAQVDRLRAALAFAPDDDLDAEVTDIGLLLVESDLQVLCSGDRAGLTALLVDLGGRLRALSDALVAVHFRTQPVQHSFTLTEWRTRRERP